MTSLVGEQFGPWQVVALAGVDGGRNRLWRCRCSGCGQEIMTAAHYLKPVHRRRICVVCKKIGPRVPAVPKTEPEPGAAVSVWVQWFLFRAREQRKSDGGLDPV